VKRLQKVTPFKQISLELTKFDTQKMQNPEISGMEYQQGTLQGYEVREYLLEKYNRQCAYCETANVPLEIEHVLPRSKGGSNRVGNLVIACRTCNEEKNNLLLDEWKEQLSKKKDKRSPVIMENIEKVKEQIKTPLKETAYMNATRWKLYQMLKDTLLEVEIGTGALTKMNRIHHDLPKTHYYDALCTGYGNCVIL
jgi:5-methylcytosine-specific restriction endonuclease McrA